jgi:hypothetical protein
VPEDECDNEKLEFATPCLLEQELRVAMAEYIVLAAREVYAKVKAEPAPVEGLPS